MTKLTTESLEKFVNDIKTDGMCDITDYQVALALRQLLAYEQAAKNPVAWDYEWASCITCEGPQDFNRIIDREAPPDWAIDEGQARNIIPLYAAPVLPKQPELVVLTDEQIDAVLDSKANMAYIISDKRERLRMFAREIIRTAMISTAPAQPVIPEGLIKAINRLLDNDGSRGCFDALEQHRAKTELERLLAEVQQNEPQNIPENIPAQPVSEPYKLPVGYFSYGTEHGFNWHQTAKQATDDAEAMIDDYRGDACDGWSEETDNVCWGVILQQATKVDERPRTDDDKCDPTIDTVCDYALLPELVGNSPVIPDGWKLVPIEPTAAMFHAFNDCDYGRKSMRERYIQMIEAAPAQESE